MPRKTVVTKEEFAEGDDLTDETDDESTQLAPLFDDLDRQSKAIDKVYVRRTEPDSGFLGTMPADVTEHAIYSKWGGGEYRLEGKNNAGRIAKVRTVKIAGDPIFLSEAEERRWRKQSGLEPLRSVAADTPKVTDLLLMMDERDEKRRREQTEREERIAKDTLEREERERRLRDDRELQMQRDRDQREDRLRKETEEREERRRREAKEDEDRRNAAHRQDMERLAAMNQTQLQQAQTFFTQLAAAMKSEDKSDPVQTLLAGMQVAREMGGGNNEPGDFLSQLMGRLPETLSELRKTGAAAYGELAGRKAGRPAGVGAEDDYLTITGPTATRAKKVLAHLAAQGKDPEKVINQLLLVAGGAGRAAAQAPAGKAPNGPRKRAGRPAKAAAVGGGATGGAATTAVRGVRGKSPVRGRAPVPAVRKRKRGGPVPDRNAGRVGQPGGDRSPAGAGEPGTVHQLGVPVEGSTEGPRAS